jgi:large subunit ribosomal protein L6e
MEGRGVGYIDGIVEANADLISSLHKAPPPSPFSSTTMAGTGRNSAVSANVGHLSRSKLYQKKGTYKHKANRKAAPAAKLEDVPATKSVDVKGGKRNRPTVKAFRFYPAEDVAIPRKSRKSASKTKLRSTITPGTVLILLAGRFRGKRVVFLKQLESGLLLVTGPFKVNGVPVRRVNQAYVIATSTKLDIADVKVRFFSFILYRR